MRQAQGVGNDGAVRLMPRGYLGKVCGSDTKIIGTRSSASL